MRISDCFISVDSEYHVNGLGQIDKVFCVCASDNKGNTFKRWVTEGPCPSLLDDISEYFGIESPIYICHYFEGAERRAFKFLGIDNSKYSYICTWHLAKMLQNSFSRRSCRAEEKERVYETEEERIEASNMLKSKRLNMLSYAVLCKSLLGVSIDTAHKEAMRKLCIEDTTEGCEQQIMDYCSDDTKYLMPILEKLSKEYYKALKGSYCPLHPGLFDDITFEDCFKYLVKQCKYINLFGEIADYGIPISPDRVDLVKKNAPRFREQLKREFNVKYPGTFTLKRDGLLHEDLTKTQEYLARCVQSFGIKDYPRSEATNRLSTAADVLKEYFHDKPCFGEDYRQLNKLIRRLGVISKTTDNPFNYIVNNRLWYESLQPYGTITSRCTPSTKRFIFGWHKSLYGVMEPEQGKWLVELDYSSEETMVQATICHDEAYNTIYNSKDIYLAFANKMHLVPDSDWNTLSKKELKEKYAGVRKQIKTLVLGLSYGLGQKKLAERLSIPNTLADNYVKNFNRILHKSTLFKSLLIPKKLNKCNAFSLPDGFICRSAMSKANNNVTTVGNWPFQSGGGMILRELVAELVKKAPCAKIICTIHDAIFFQVDEGDMSTIEAVSEIMREVANKTLNAPEGWSIKVGAPDIIQKGAIWCTDDETFVEQFKELMSFTE